ncbi:ubiquitin-protein ligase, Cullin 4 [Anaeromyces robustus]|uniref:Ubiquitin-protein ligase, Cullin 4 n=1 Tax=Anaeromyces robustus TaxID=1754192 RepID=A0A1Y1XPD2_9FUNG|nr:ubiquitin-protein ligase, Cullin 4 [Anaeromyces robustus]|eukprot:ORX87608.1 ubiquitin-protein ligase, Cullin 4 [Anaeromyces robustus]
MNSLRKTFSLKGKKNLYFNNHLERNKRAKTDLAFNKMNDVNMYNADNNLLGFPTDGKQFEIKTTRKKIEFCPLQDIPTLTINFDMEWKRLKTAMDAIYNSTPLSDSLEELYTLCENLCKYNYASKLYENIKNELINYLKQEFINISAKLEDENFIVSLSSLWISFCKKLIMIRSIFLYLDRTYALREIKIGSLWSLGLELFKTYVVNITNIRIKTINDLLQFIECDRQKNFMAGNEKNTYILLRTIIKMFIDLNIYEDFEISFLDASTEFYRNESRSYINKITVATNHGQLIAEYLQRVEAYLNEEVERCNLGCYNGYVDSITRKNVTSIVENEMIKNYINVILEKGFDHLINTKSYTDLNRLYNLVNRVDLLESLRVYFCNYIKKTGSFYVLDSSKDPIMIQSLLDFKKDLDDVLELSFSNNERFVNTVKEGFETFINERQNKPAELISKYIDSKLRQVRNIPEETIEEIQERCMFLFRFINGKDIFEAYYKKDLSKRLLLFSKSINIDLEKSMIAKLKDECGGGYTSKLEGMFKDMSISKDLIAEFNKTAECSRIGNISLYVNVLTSGFWPSYPQSNYNMPKELLECQNTFSDFYLKSHSGRVLQWQNSLGFCVLKADFPKSPKELIVSLAQAIILLLFNNGEVLTYREIEAVTQMNTKELKKSLQSLSCGKYKVLIKSTEGKNVIESDSFAFNKDFESASRVLKINSIQAKESLEERKTTREKVFKDRQYQIDAAIVRIMKARKTISHPILLSELFKQLKFSIMPQDIKTRIESLIERDYIKRDLANNTIYHYVL